MAQGTAHGPDASSPGHHEVTEACLHPNTVSGRKKQREKTLNTWRGFKIIFFYLCFRESRREGEREGEKHWRGRETSISCLSHRSHQGPNPQPKHMPWPGTKQVTFCLAGGCPTHWATPARAGRAFFKVEEKVLIGKIFLPLPTSLLHT